MSDEKPDPNEKTKYRVYQIEVNSLKNYSKLKSRKYLVKILFYLDKLVSCSLPSCKITGV